MTTLTGLLGPVKEVLGMTAVLNPTRKVDDKGEVKVEADENTMLIMNHGNGVLSHVQTGFVYYERERAPQKAAKLYTVDIMGTQGTMHVQGWDWGPAGSAGVFIASWLPDGVFTFSIGPGPDGVNQDRPSCPLPRPLRSDRVGLSSLPVGMRSQTDSEHAASAEALVADSSAGF